MYTSSIDLYRQPSKLNFNTLVYNKLAEIFHLPGLEKILEALQNPTQYINWGDTAYSALEVYHLEDLIAPPYGDKYVMEIRFKASKEARKKTSVFLSIQNDLVQNMSIQFPGRAGRTAGSHVLAMIKSAAHLLRMHPGDVCLEVEGFYEVDRAGWIREKTLSAFCWIEGLDRYLHVDEDPRKVQEVKRGIRDIREY